MTTAMLSAADVVAAMKKDGLGYERVVQIDGSSYKDVSTVVIAPTRGMVHHRVVSAWQALMAPMNGKRAFLFAVGHEVGKAYDAMISSILANPDLSTWKYVLTLEDDNLPPPDAHLKLLESIESTGFDAMSAMYFTKGPYNMPMAYGDPASKSFDFRPRDVREALAAGQVMPVNGIAMGCALWRMDLFRKVEPPWFVTAQEFTEGVGAKAYTQDLFFCERAVRQHGARFGVDCRVRVGHMDVNTGDVY